MTYEQLESAKDLKSLIDFESQQLHYIIKMQKNLHMKLEFHINNLGAKEKIFVPEECVEIIHSALFEYYTNHLKDLQTRFDKL